MKNSLLLFLTVFFSFAGYLSAATQQIDKVDGQYLIKTDNYMAIVPPTGMLSYLTVGLKEIINQPISLCPGKYFDSESREYICSKISQTAPNILLCEGEMATIRYEFASAGLLISVTVNGKENSKVFVTLSGGIEGIWTDGRFQGKKHHPSDGRDGEYYIKEFKIFNSNQLISMGNVTVFIGPRLLRFDCPAGKTFSSMWTFAPATEADIKLFATQALYRESITVLTPKDYQVFQRQKAGSGVVKISGRLMVDCETIEYRFAGREIDSSWHALRVNKVTGDFSGNIILPAGGWYSCEFRANKNGKEFEGKTIAHVGVGEVFIVSGQSNSTNSGEKALKTESGMVSSFNGYDWRLANDPQYGAHDISAVPGTGGSFLPQLGDLLYQHFKVPVAFSMTGHGGYDIAQWQPFNENFTWLQSRIEQLGPQGFRMVLWHQGEADCPTPKEEYYTRLKNLVEISNQRAGWSFPWMVAQVGGTQTRGAKVKLWNEGIVLEGPDTDTLRGAELRYQNGAHFTEKGLRLHATLWMNKITPYIDKILNEK